MNPNVNAAFALLGRLKDHGITHCVISPGSRSTPLSYVAHQLFETNVIIDERDNGFLALGIAQATGVAPICITTSGSAPSHLFPAVAEAFNSNVGMIVISADRPHELRSVGAAQTINQVDLFGTHVRYSFDTKLASEVSDDNYWRDIADELYFATHESALKRGPAHLNIAFDEHLSPDGDETYTAAIPSEAEGSDRSDDGSLDLSQYDTGVITLGRNSHISLEALKSLSESTGFPILADVTSNARHDEVAITNYDAVARSSDFKRMIPEIILQFGDPLGSKVWNHKVKPAKLIAFKKYDDERDPHLQASQTIICSDLPVILSKRIESKDLLTLSKKCSEEITSKFNIFPDSEPALFNDLGKTLEDFEGNILLGNSMPIRYAEWFWSKTNKNSTIYCNRGTNGIDGTISCATGIALGSKKQTVCVLGDVTFAHDIGFLPHAVSIANKYDLNITFVVVDNNGGAIFSHLEQGKNEAMQSSYEEIMQTPTNIDFEVVANAFGCKVQNELYLNDLKPGVDVAVLKTDHLSGRKFLSQ